MREATGITTVLCCRGGGEVGKRPNKPLFGLHRGCLLDTELWPRPSTHCQDNMSLWPGIAWGSSRRSWKAVLVGGKSRMSSTACCHQEAKNSFISQMLCFHNSFFHRGIKPGFCVTLKANGQDLQKLQRFTEARLSVGAMRLLTSVKVTS